MKFKRDNGYKQQKRLKHETAINKYTGKFKEKKLRQNFITKLQNQFDFESQLTTRELLREDNQIF